MIATTIRMNLTCLGLNIRLTKGAILAIPQSSCRLNKFSIAKEVVTLHKSSGGWMSRLPRVENEKRHVSEGRQDRCGAASRGGSSAEVR